MMSEMFFFFFTYRVFFEDEWSRLQHSSEVNLAGPLGIFQSMT